MYDVKSLTATPGLARRLLQFSQINRLDFNTELAELALSDLLEPSDLQSFAFPIDKNQLASLQFVRDWNGRAMILSDMAEQARHVALASSWLSGGKTLVMAQPKFYSEWAHLIRESFPSSKISVFGNPRYLEKGVKFPDGVVFEERPDLAADFFITSYGGLIWHDLLNTVAINQTIVEELDSQGSVNYKWINAVKGLFHEIPSPLFIQDINHLPQDAGRGNLASLQTHGSKAMDFIGSCISDYLWAGMTHMNAITNGSNLRENEDYLSSVGYSGVDNLKLLSLFGVSSHLLDDIQGNKTPLTFYDSTIQTLLRAKPTGGRAESGLQRLVARERAVEEATGVKLYTTVQSALEGQESSMTLIGGLKTTQWANLKAQHLKTIHTQLANRMTKCLFLTENTDIKRALLLNLGPLLEDLSTSSDRTLTKGRFLHPIVSVPLTWEQQANMRPLSNIIITIDDLIQEPDLLLVSNFLFLAEPPMSQSYWDDIKAVAAISGTRIVNGVILKTFEEHISKQLL